MTHLFAILSVASAVLPARSFTGPVHSEAPPMDSVMVANFLLALAAIVCLKEQRQARVFVLGFAISTAAIAVLGLLHGAWTLGTIVALWSILSFWHWAHERYPRRFRVRMSGAAGAVLLRRWQRESRVSRLFGTGASDFRN
jgi:hypothetical protein